MASQLELRRYLYPSQQELQSDDVEQNFGETA